MTTFGIDLGTTCSAIGWVRDGQVELIQHGPSVLLPSVVLFAEDGSVVVGEAAENQGLLHPGRLFRSTKRHMGTSRSWLVDGQARSPVDIAGHILSALCDGAEKATGERPHDVVLSVPAWFQQNARADTRAAAELAGLNVVRLINEPTAAALAHANGEPRDRLALVFDLGGGTFDVSIVDQQGELVEVLASRGDAQLGGDDLDEKLLERSLEGLSVAEPDLAQAAQTNPGALEKLARAAREAKHALSSELKTTLRVPFLMDFGGQPRHVEQPFDRDDLEQDLDPILARALACVDEVLADAGKSASDIEDALLVGGATQSPLVWAALRSTYGWEASSAIPPQEAVAMGAALQAALIDGIDVGSQLLDVAPHPIGVTALVERRSAPPLLVNSIIVPRNSPLPGRFTHRFFTTHPEQSELDVQVLQGSDANPLRTLMLGELTLTDIPPAPPGEPNRPLAAEITHDPSGMVSVRIIDELSGKDASIVVTTGAKEADRLRQELIARCRDHLFTPGDGSDPDPFLEQDAPPAQAPEGADPERIADATAAFSSVLKLGKKLDSHYPGQATRLRQLASDGQAALAQNQSTLALALHDELADFQFEEGIYL